MSLSDLEAVAIEAIDLYEGLLDKARRQRMIGDKKAWARKAAAVMLVERHRPAQAPCSCPPAAHCQEVER